MTTGKAIYDYDRRKMYVGAEHTCALCLREFTINPSMRNICDECDEILKVVLRQSGRTL